MLDKLAADIEAQLKRLQRRRIFQDDGQSMGTAAAYEKPQNRMFCVVESCLSFELITWYV